MAGQDAGRAKVGSSTSAARQKSRSGVAARIASEGKKTPAKKATQPQTAAELAAQSEDDDSTPTDPARTT